MAGILLNLLVGEYFGEAESKIHVKLSEKSCTTGLRTLTNYLTKCQILAYLANFNFHSGSTIKTFTEIHLEVSQRAN